MISEEFLRTCSIQWASFEVSVASESKLTSALYFDQRHKAGRPFNSAGAVKKLPNFTKTSNL